MVANSTTLQDWLRAHRALIEAEQRFAALATGFAAGTVTQQQLDETHDEILALRMLCEAVFQKAVATLGKGC